MEDRRGEVQNALRDCRIVPVVRIEKEAYVEPLKQALLAGGIHCMEITYRTKAAQAAIAQAVKKKHGFFVGAGTVLYLEQAKEAIEAGVDFVVTPGYDRKIVDYCKGQKILVIPGCSTCAELNLALEDQLSLVKFFPAQASGGTGWLKAVGAPYPMLQFMPTGGISTSNVREYLALDNVAACGGSWIAPPEQMMGQRFDQITENARYAMELAKGDLTK